MEYFIGWIFGMVCATLIGIVVGVVREGTSNHQDSWHQDSWSEIDRFLNELYIIYYDGQKREHETALAVERLMRAYNIWID